MRSLPATTYMPPARPAAPATTTLPPAPRGPGSLLIIPSGCIATELRPLSQDARRRVATYELLLANDSPSPVAAYAYVEGRPAGGMASWNAITVGPFAAIAVTLDVGLPERARRAQRLVVEIHADLAHLTLDATPQVAVATIPRRSALAVAAAAAVFAIVTAFALARPRVVALAAPDQATAGGHIDVAYATAGSGSWRYRLQTPDGMQVRAGTLDRRSGAFDIDLPPSSGTQSYDLLLMGAGGLGTDSRTAHILALPPARRVATSAPVSISSLTVAREIVESGAPVIASYHTDAASGTVQLVDGGGVVQAQAPLSALGTSTLQAPTVKRDEEFAVVVRAARGGSTAESSVGLVVRSAEPQYVDLSGVGDGTQQGSQGAAHAAPQGGAPFALPLGPIAAGTPIDIAIVDERPGMHIGLATESGEELASVNVERGQRNIGLMAPDVPQDTKYLIEAAYPSPIGEETVIRPIVVHRRQSP